MANWKKAFRVGVAAAADRQRSPKAQAQLRRFAEAHEKSLTSLYAAYAEGLIDENTFNSELREEKTLLTSELRGAPSVPKASAAAAAGTIVRSLDDAMHDDED
jgi:hypothetical protein